MRDKLLGKSTADIDLACVGNVKRAGERLAKELDAEFNYYPPFKTGTLQGPKGERMDIARTRKETYPRPGELPKVESASIEDDLYRRDFTVNAMALSLHLSDFGRLIDPLNGQEDLKRGLIRVIHDASFVDDPTRIFRAVRYAERLGFRIEPHTLKLLKDAVNRIPDLSGERILYELRCISEESRNARVRIIKRLALLGALGFLAEPVINLSPAKLMLLREAETCEFLCLLLSHFEEQPVRTLPLQKRCVETIATLRKRKGILAKLAHLKTPSKITFYLKAYDQRGLRIIRKTTKARAGKKITEYLDNYSKIRIRTTGEDLKQLGIPPGPRYQKLLAGLLAARLDGKVRTKLEEKSLLERWKGME